MSLRIEWDPEKAEANRSKHGVSFSEAATVLADPLSVTLPDPDHSTDEERVLLLGQSDLEPLTKLFFQRDLPGRSHLLTFSAYALSRNPACSPPSHS